MKGKANWKTLDLLYKKYKIRNNKSEGQSLYLSPSNGLIIARTILLHDESLMICESHNGLSLMPINDLSIPRVWA